MNEKRQPELMAQQLSRIRSELDTAISQRNLDAVRPNHPNPKLAGMEHESGTDALPDQGLPVIVSGPAHPNHLAEDLRDQVKLLRDESDLLRQRVSDLTSESEILKGDLESAKSSLANLEEQKAKIRIDRDKLATDQQDFDRDLARLYQIDQMQADLNEKFIKLQGDSIAISESREACKKETEALTELRAITEPILKLKSRVRDLQSTVDILEADLASKIQTIDEQSKRAAKDAKSVNRIKLSNQNLKVQISVLSDSIKSSAAETKKLKSEKSKCLKEISNLQKLLNTELRVRHTETMQWMIEKFKDPGEKIVCKKVLLNGEGPYPEGEFINFITELDFEPFYRGYDHSIEVLVVGSKTWNLQDLLEQIEQRDGKGLKIYSQELFLLMLALKRDPLTTVSVDDLLLFVKGHPAFEYLLSLDFPWPDSEILLEPTSAQKGDIKGLVDNSPLFKFGYSVAKQAGLVAEQRQSLLTDFYNSDSLTFCVSQPYMDAWGQSATRNRLHRMAWHIFYLTRSHRQHKQAVDKWLEDLKWLKDNFHSPLQRFSWPS